MQTCTCTGLKGVHVMIMYNEDVPVVYLPPPPPPPPPLTLPCNLSLIYQVKATEFSDIKCNIDNSLPSNNPKFKQTKRFGYFTQQNRTPVSTDPHDHPGSHSHHPGPHPHHPGPHPHHPGPSPPDTTMETALVV